MTRVAFSLLVLHEYSVWLFSLSFSVYFWTSENTIFSSFDHRVIVVDCSSGKTLTGACARVFLSRKIFRSHFLRWNNEIPESMDSFILRFAFVWSKIDSDFAFTLCSHQFSIRWNHVISDRFTSIVPMMKFDSTNSVIKWISWFELNVLMTAIRSDRTEFYYLNKVVFRLRKPRPSIVFLLSSQTHFDQPNALALIRLMQLVDNRKWNWIRPEKPTREKKKTILSQTESHIFAKAFTKCVFFAHSFSVMFSWMRRNVKLSTQEQSLKRFLCRTKYFVLSFRRSFFETHKNIKTLTKLTKTKIDGEKPQEKLQSEERKRRSLCWLQDTKIVQRNN